MPDVPLFYFISTILAHRDVFSQNKNLKITLVEARIILMNLVLFFQNPFPKRKYQMYERKNCARNLGGAQFIYYFYMLLCLVRPLE